jgi:hypothetical protein
MTVCGAESAGDLDLVGLSNQLQQAGWDVLAGHRYGEVAARREWGPGRDAWSLVIDRSGRWRFTATQALDVPSDRDVTRNGHSLRLLKQTQQVLTMAGRVADQTDLPGLLAALTQLALEETGASAHHAEGTATWHVEKDPRAALNHP